MAKKHTNEVAVGTLVLLSLALTVYIVVALGGGEGLFAKTQHITVKLPYWIGLKGLAKGSPVLMGGAKIGQITEAYLGSPEPFKQTKPVDPNEPTPQTEEIYVYFTMEIPRQYKLRTDCVLAPESNVLGGQAALAIKNVGRVGEVLQDNDVVTSIRFEGSLADAIDSLKEELNASRKGSLMHRMKSILIRIDEQVTIDDDQKSLMAKLHLAMDKVNSGLDEIDDLVKTNKSDITTAIGAFKNTAVQIETATPDILAKLEKVLDTINPTIEKAQEVIADIKDTVTVNRPMIDKLMVNLNEISVNLKLASREIRRAPWKLLYTPKKGELHIQGLIDSAGDFATGAERLDSVSLRLQAVMSDADERTPEEAERIGNLLAELETSFEQFRKAEEKFWNEIK